MPKSPGVVRIAALGDIHLGRAAYGPPVQTIFTDVAEQADILLLCGDLTDRGEPEEGRQIAKALEGLGLPIVAVLGNHDYESGQAPELKRILCESGIQVLDGDAIELQGVGFAGVKGFAGGFGRRALGPWGEEIIKLFVREAVNEALGTRGFQLVPEANASMLVGYGTGDTRVSDQVKDWNVAVLTGYENDMYEKSRQVIIDIYNPAKTLIWQGSITRLEGEDPAQAGREMRSEIDTLLSHFPPAPGSTPPK